VYITYCVIPSCCLAEGNDEGRKNEHVRNIIRERERERGRERERERENPGKIASFSSFET